MSYFCSVKKVDMTKRAALLLLAALAFVFARAVGAARCDGETGAGTVGDSVHVSLLTCSPHNEVYSLYGHTALRYLDERSGVDVAVNYGVFSFNEPNFILRFVFGLTDYEMGIQPFEEFCREYAYYGSSVTQQELDLTADEKRKIFEALNRNALPENIRYRYNFLYNNCTTKARDIVLENISGKVVYDNIIDTETSFRDIIHSCNATHRWARFGNDLLMGVKADAKTDRAEQEFLPANLMRDFGSAMVVRDGKKTPLVKSTTFVVTGNDKQEKEENDSWLCPTPALCFIVLFIVTLLMPRAEKMTGRRFWGFDTALLLLTGVAGLVLTAMIFSQHPTVSLNLQILVLNPVMLFFAYYTVKHRKHGDKLKRMYTAVAVFAALAIICSLIQDFAEGIALLALSLLERSWSNIRYYGKTTENADVTETDRN